MEVESWVLSTEAGGQRRGVERVLMATESSHTAGVCSRGCRGQICYIAYFKTATERILNVLVTKKWRLSEMKDNLSVLGWPTHRSKSTQTAHSSPPTRAVELSVNILVTTACHLNKSPMHSHSCHAGAPCCVAQNCFWEPGYPHLCFHPNSFLADPICSAESSSGPEKLDLGRSARSFFLAWRLLCFLGTGFKHLHRPGAFAMLRLSDTCIKHGNTSLATSVTKGMSSIWKKVMGRNGNSVRCLWREVPWGPALHMPFIVLSTSSANCPIFLKCLFLNSPYEFVGSLFQLPSLAFLSIQSSSWYVRALNMGYLEP